VNTQGNERLRELLAAEYALGTLRGGARRRFEHWARNDDGLRALALAWSERLAPLVDGIPSAVPRERVWDAIEARLPGSSTRQVANSIPTTTGAFGWWDRLALWRGLSAAFAVAAVIAIGLASRPAPFVGPTVVQVASEPGAVATLVDPKSGAPVAVVLTSKDGDAIQVKVAADVQVPAGKVLQLWTARSDVAGMQSMGVLPADVRLVTGRAQPLDAATLAKVKAFGLSLEPAGGSPVPTQVLGLGALVRLSS
jgi:anti-sigma-K factor RskA